MNEDSESKQKTERKGFKVDITLPTIGESHATKKLKADNQRVLRFGKRRCLKDQF